VLDNRLTDGGEVVSHKRRPPFTPKKIPDTHFFQRLSRPQVYSAAGRIRSIKNPNDLIGNRSLDLPACSIVPQPITLPSAPRETGMKYKNKSEIKNEHCSLKKFEIKYMACSVFKKLYQVPKKLL
jgi:hypothetical protein